MLKNQLSKKFNSTARCQQTFIQSLEGIGDILVFETKKKKNKFVVEKLRETYNLFESFFLMKDSNPEKFERLLLLPEYFHMYEKNKRDAGLALAFNTEKYLVGFSSILDQIVRVHEAAISSNNEEVSRYAIIHIIQMLEVLTSSSNNDVFIEQILRTLSSIGRKTKEQNNRSAYLALVDWYIHIVFSNLEKGKFQLEYLKTLDNYFFGNIQHIISKNRANLFNSLVSALVNSLHISDHTNVYEYAHTFMNFDYKKYNALDGKFEIEKKVRELESSYNRIFSKEFLDEWIKKLEELTSILESNFLRIEGDKIIKLKKKIKASAISKFKYNNLLEIIFAVGAYCIFKDKPEFIKYLWEYKQPPDADASWGGEDIIPKNLEELTYFYFRKAYFEKGIDFQEDHRGSERYYKFYFLLLLFRYLKSISSSADGQYPQINDIRFPDLTIGRLSGIDYEANEFSTLLKDFIKEKKLLFVMEFDSDNLKELEKKSTIFLNVLKEKAKLNIEVRHINQSISLKKIEEFKNKFIKGFYENANFRDIFKNYLHKYQEKLDKNGGKHLGINHVDDKAIFFDDWYISYDDIGEHYGNNMAILEDAYLLNEISGYCEEVFQLNDALDKFENLDDVFIIFSGVRNLFLENDNFRTKWDKNTKQLEIKGFEGRYKHNGKFIPVFEVNRNRNEDVILLLNKNKFGSLNQYSPLNGGDKKLLSDIFSIRVRSFSEDKDASKELLDNPPNWLAELKEKEKMVNLLNTRALIQIFGNYEFQKDSGFGGYILKIKAK